MNTLRNLISLPLASLIPAAVNAQGSPYGWEHPMGWMWGAWGIGMGVIMLFFLGAIIVAIVLSIRWLISQGKTSQSDSALEILRQRYARGEINKEEFETKKRDLS
jgi:putative membrane protein